MKKIILLAFSFSFLFFALSSCTGVLMPYHETYECQRGTNSGYCGPIDKVYKQTLREGRNEN